MATNSTILTQQLQALLSSPAISANAVSSFFGTANSITKGVDISFSMVDITGVSTITLRRNYLNDLATATVLQTWTALVAPYTWSDTDAALQTSGAAYYWLVLSPTGTSGTASNIGPQEVVLNPQLTAPVEATSISASHAAAANGAVLVTVNVNGVPNPGSIKIYITGYQGNSNPVAVAQQSSSPLQFTLLATGETVTLQAIGVSAGGTEAASGPTTTLVLNGTATVPAEPQGVTVAQIPAGNQISFPASLDNVTSYQIWRANQGDPFSSATLLHTITATNVGTIEYLDTGGFSGNYEYFVVAVNAAGSSLPSNPSQVNFIAASSVIYVDGVAVQALQPAAAGSDVTADQPIVYTGLSANLIPNGTFILDNMTGWVAATGGGAAPTYRSAITHGLNGFELATNTSGCSPTFNVIPGQKYRFSFTCWTITAGAQKVTHRLAYGTTYAPNTQPSGSNLHIDFLSNGSIAGTPTTYTYDWTCPANVFYASLLAYESAGGVSTQFYSNFAAQDYVAAAQWGADVTGSNTADNTNNVGTLPSNDITSTINPGGGVSMDNTVDGTSRYAAVELGADNTLSHVIFAVDNQNLSNVPINTANPIISNLPTVYTVATFTIISNSSTDVFSLQAVLQWAPNGSTLPFGGAQIYSSLDCYLDAPGFVGTSPNFGVAQPTPGTYVTFGFGPSPAMAASQASLVNFFGSITGLSPGSHTLALVFNNWSQSQVVNLLYVYAVCQQISS